MKFGQREPVAARGHLCDWCDRSIPRGTLYRRWAYEHEGSCFTVKAHVGCDDVGMAWCRDARAAPQDRVIGVGALTGWALARIAAAAGVLRPEDALAAALEQMAEANRWPDGDLDRLLRLLRPEGA